MDVKDILIAAKQAVDEAEIPQDLRSMAFGKAVDLFSGAVGQTNGKPGKSTPTPRTSDTEAESASPVDRIAKRLKLDPVIVGEVFHAEDGEIRVTVPAAKLESGKKGGTRQLALLVAAGRQAAGMEDFTPMDKVREVVEDYRKHDSPNFARTISEMSDTFNFLGSSRNRSIKVSRPGWEAASRLVNTLGGGES